MESIDLTGKSYSITIQSLQVEAETMYPNASKRMTGFPLKSLIVD